MQTPDMSKYMEIILLGAQGSKNQLNYAGWLKPQIMKVTDNDKYNLMSSQPPVHQEPFKNAYFIAEYIYFISRRQLYTACFKKKTFSQVVIIE